MMSNDLKRTLNLPDSISIVIGSMIGSGIFLVSADIARQVDSAWLLMVVWFVAGLTSLSGAMAYGELATNITDAGGQYMYLKKIFNDLTAFLYGWTLLLMIQSAAIAAICIATAKFLGIIVPFVSSEIFIFNIAGHHFLSTQQVIALATCILLTYINSRGVKSGVITQNIFTVTKILSVIAIVLCGIFVGFNWEVVNANFPQGCAVFEFSRSNIEMIATATVGALFATITWNNLTFITGEIIEPEKNVPRALVIGVGSVVILYLLVNAVYVFTIPLDTIKTVNEDIVAAAAMSAMFGKIGEIIIAIIIMISTFGCANGMIMTGARVYYQMAKDRLFFSKLAHLDEKTDVPANSLWAQCAWICLLILFCGNYSELLDYVIYSALIFYVITTIGIFVFRYKFPESEQKLRINSFYGLFFIIASSYIIYSLTIHKALHSMRALGLVLLGIPVYLLWKKFGSHSKMKLAEVTAEEKAAEEAEK